MHRVRELSRVPVVVVSARGREEDKVAALDAGADDYLTKPFGTSELLARMRVALRHARAGSAPGSPVLEVGPLRMDLDRREVSVEGRAVRLTPIEWRLLELLPQLGHVHAHVVGLRRPRGPQTSRRSGGG